MRTLCRADFTKSGLFSSSCLSCSRTASSVRLNVPLQQHNSTHVNKSVTTAIKSWPTTMHFWNSGTFSCTIAASCLTCALYHVLSTDCDCRKLRTLISGVCCQSALTTTMLAADVDLSVVCPVLSTESDYHYTSEYDHRNLLIIRCMSHKRSTVAGLLFITVMIFLFTTTNK